LSFSSKRARASGVRRFAASTTRPVSAGKAGSAAIAKESGKSQAKIPSTAARRASGAIAHRGFPPPRFAKACTTRLNSRITVAPSTHTELSELHLRWLLGSFRGGEFGHRLRRTIKGRGPEHRREGAQRRVELAHRIDVIAPCHRDAIFRALDL